MKITDRWRLNQKERKITLIFLILTLLTFVTLYHQGKPNGEKISNSRQIEIRSKSAEVMPFSLDKTTHYFSKTENGGVEEVSVKSESEGGEIELIRAHLKEISLDFTKGDYSKVKYIHGGSMPGIKVLEKNFRDVEIIYSESAKGARIEYKSNRKEIINAIHNWFDAQLADHGNDARLGVVASATGGMNLSSTDTNANGMSEEMMCRHHPESCAKNL